MRLKHSLRLLKSNFLLAGTSLILLSIFAIRLGIDNDPGWGKGRILLLIGLLLLIGVLIAHFHTQVNPFWQLLSRRFSLPQRPPKTAPAAPGFLSRPPFIKQLSHSPALQHTLALSAGLLLSLLVFSAMITSATPPARSSNYYEKSRFRLSP